jgi:hypothetical protein
VIDEHDTIPRYNPHEGYKADEMSGGNNASTQPHTYHPSEPTSRYIQKYLANYFERSKMPVKNRSKGYDHKYSNESKESRGFFLSFVETFI